MTAEEIRKRLIRHHVLAAWPEGALDALIEACTLRTFHVGEALWQRGEPGDAAFVLVSGRVERALSVHPDGHRAEQLSEPGALLSLSSLVQAWEHTSSAVALEHTEALELTRETFQLLFDASQPGAFALVDAIAENLVHDMRDVNRRLHQVFGQPAETLRLLRRRMRESEG